MVSYQAGALILLLMILSVAAYYLMRGTGACSEDDHAACQAVQDLPHVIPGSAMKACDRSTGKLSPQCTATCAPPWVWSTQSQQCVRQTPTCSSDTGCGGPGQGRCVQGLCVCEPGWSGAHCEYGVKCSDKLHCGPGGTCDKNGNCVCKGPGWKSGRLPDGEYVMCGACAEGWGPDALAGDCSKVWATHTLKTQDCSYKYLVDGGTNPCQVPRSFAAFMNQSYLDPVTGFNYQGAAERIQYCDNGAPCASCVGADYQHLCKVTGWHDPGTQDEDCSGGARPAGSYMCCNAYQSCS